MNSVVIEKDFIHGFSGPSFWLPHHLLSLLFSKCEAFVRLCPISFSALLLGRLSRNCLIIALFSLSFAGYYFLKDYGIGLWPLLSSSNVGVVR